MDATQQIDDPFSEEEEEHEEEEKGRPEREQLATLKVFKNDHIPESEFPLYVGENVIGRDPAACSVLLPARSVSGRHAVISISVFRSSSDRFENGEDVEALLWDMASLNGTRKGRLKLTPQVRYALTEGQSVVFADIPCQYVGRNITKKDTRITPEKGGVSKKEKVLSSSDSESELRNKLNVKERSVLPPVPLWSSEDEQPIVSSPQSAHKQPEITLVPESDSDGESAPDERKDFVSDSASSSHPCSSTNSSFLTPAKSVIPESEDESSITPSLAASIDRFRLRQTPDLNSSNPGPLVLNLDSDIDLEEKDMEKSKSEPEALPALAAKVEPVSSAKFHMDSDTDVEEEEPETSKAEPKAQEAVTLEKSLSSVGLHMDSDTDVEEDAEEKNKTEPEVQIEQAPSVGPASSADLHMDSDTDVEEEEPDASKAKPEAQEAVTLDKSVSSVGLHMDSDTDVEEDAEEKSKNEPKVHTEEAPKVQSDLHMDSDTDVEDNEASVTENVSRKEAVTVNPQSAAVPHTEFHLDSDTDVEDDSSMKISTATEVSLTAGEQSDVKPTLVPGTELNMDSDTDVDEENEDKEKVIAKDLLSNSETDYEDHFKPLPIKAVKVAQSHKVSVGSKAEQSEESTHKKQDYLSQAKTNFEEPTQAFGDLEEDWDLMPTQAYGAVVASARLKPKQPDLEATQAYGTETDKEEDQEPLNHTQPYSNLSTAETQLIPVEKPDEEEEEDKETQNDSHLSTADTLILASTPKREEQTQPFSLFTAQTQLVFEGEDKEIYQNEPTQLMTDTTDETQEGEENMKRGRRNCGEGTVHKGKNTSSCLIIAETQPMCEEEEATDADLSEDSFQKQQAEKYDSAHLAENNLSSHHTIAETQPMCDDEETPDQDNVVSSTRIEKPSSSHITIAETQPMFEEDEAPEDDVSRRQTKDEPIHHNEKASTSNHAILETQTVGEDDEGQEKELSSKTSIRRSRRCRPKNDKEVPQPAEAVVDHTIAETQPMCEEEQIEDLKTEVSSGKQNKNQQAHEFKSPEFAEMDLKACVNVAETQPMCEEEAAPCEDLTDAVSTRQIDEDRSTELPIPSSSHVSVNETQPVQEEDEGQEKVLSSKLASRSSRRGRPKKDDEVKQTAEAAVHKTITETQPVPEEVIEKDKDLNSAMKSSRSRRGRQMKEDTVPQPAEAAISSISINTETQPVHEDITERDEELIGIRSKRPRKGRQKDEGEPAQSSEPNSDLSVVETQPMVEPSGRSSRRQRKENTELEKENPQEEPSGRSSRRQRKENTEVESETSASSKVQGKPRKGQEGKRKRGKALSEDEEESEEEKPTRRGTRRTGVKLKCSEKEEEEKLEERNAQEEKKRMEKELQEREEIERLEMEEKEKLKFERKKQEELKQRERAETEMRQKELEEKERLKREEEEKMRKENERIQREKEEKDRLEKEEKERLERERRQLEEQRRKEEEERIQREKEVKDRLEKEEKKRLERERRELEEQRRKEEEERIQREKEEKDRLEKEKERLERESREQEEQKRKEEEERIQKETERSGVERARGQKKTNERNHQKQLKNEQLEEDKTKLEAPLVPPARRSRRCSSSSMNSDQSVSSKQEVPSQRGRGQGRGRGRGRGKQTADEQPINARKSGRRGPASAVEDPDQNSSLTTRSRSRSSSRSSERSAQSIEPSNQGTRGRGRGRKSIKLPEPEVASQAKTSGKGRGRGGRRSGAENVNVVEDNEREQDAKVAEDNTAVPQTNSRGRKRAANTSTSPEEAPAPTPKTPRRSVASQALKVLFTGLTDEDGERVVSRLGGSLAKGVNDMTHLVTDKARRTVKFLCAVARGVPIVTPDWLKKCGKAGHFLSTDEYILKDAEQEKKFSFSLQKSLQTAQSQPLLKGYGIHVTPSVMPEPSQMKEIIICCGARYLPKMPSAQKSVQEHTVVVSCEQDRALCDKAESMSLPVVSTEFLLTGILQQRVDLQAYSLTSSLNTSNQPAAPKAAARGRRK